MKHLLMCLMAGFSIHAYSQPEIGRKPLLIAPVTPSTPSIGTVQPKAPSIFDEKVTDDRPLSEPKTFSMTPADKYVDPSQEYTDKMNKESGEVKFKVYRKDYYLGDIRTKAESVTIRYRDAGQVDGDVITVYVNGDIVRPNIMLAGDYLGFELGLVPGFNKIEFQAVNEGHYQPNTAEYMILDGKNLLVSSGWNLFTGFKGTYIIIRE